jgi:hypothetical protein
MTPPLCFQLKKRPDAKALLVLVRADGTFTSGAVGPASGYGPAHDLAHYVVESTLGLSQGFLGLVASGWEITDFEVKGTAKRLPVEALLAEAAAGELSRQEMMQQYSTAEEFVWALGLVMEQMGHPASSVLPIDEATFARMKERLVALRNEWWTVEPGRTMELVFPG